MNKIMKAISVNQIKHKLQTIDIPLPSIKQDEILVKTLLTGICSTDRELLDSPKIVPPRGSDYLIIGHEVVGEVIETGSNISLFQKGDIVVSTIRRGCGKCIFCNSGRSDICSTGHYEERGILGSHGFMSEYFIEKGECLIKVPKNLKERAVLVEPLSVGVKAVEESFRIQKCRLYGNSDIQEEKIFKKVLVVGAGSIGLLSALVLRNLGVDLICLDIDNEDGVKANIIKTMGGQYINLNQYIKDDPIDLNKLRDHYEIGMIDLIIDASGNPLTCLQLIDLLQYNGICVLLSLPPRGKLQTFDFNQVLSTIVNKNQIILGSVNSNYNHFMKAVHHLEQAGKTFNTFLDKIITHRYPFSKYQEAFNVKSTNRIKVVLNWE